MIRCKRIYNNGYLQDFVDYFMYRPETLSYNELKGSREGWPFSKTIYGRDYI